jgi:lysine biosynthesis protein LysW
MARCPECNAKLLLISDFKLWDHIFCEECGTELEVVELSPLELEVVIDIEDYEDDFDDFEPDEDDLDWDLDDDNFEDEEW